ncbi:hypothetical protein GCM10011375_38160 [Hymenobacter qilianensis]|uniref:Uncharacterized protein n=1 Tax=Hymenobacter qilianensis TaxID=1385715 RepID=A0ACB5PWR6_9BACT|nr:hypothetical protein [Hymenobacter qilianensis]GGF79458.1 hypothetical protein GCM10011375_38160 [Hymenobacter qilianensis]
MPRPNRYLQYLAQGLVLDKGWKWQAGDNPEWAKAAFNDSKQTSGDSTKDTFEVPQMLKKGLISWLRLRLAFGTTRPQSLARTIPQAGACEIQLNGKLIYQLGALRTAAGQIKAFNLPKILVSFPVSPDPVQGLAIRYAFPPNIHYATHFGMMNPLFLGAIHPADTAVSTYPNADPRDRNRDIAKIPVFALLYRLFSPSLCSFPDGKPPWISRFTPFAPPSRGASFRR